MIDATLAANSLSDAVAQELIPVIAIGGGLVFTAFIILCGTIKSVSVSRSREATKREVAAYVAEGTITPDDAVRMITAGQGTDAKEIVAKRAADGWITAKKADQLIQSLEKHDPSRT